VFVFGRLPDLNLLLFECCVPILAKQVILLCQTLNYGETLLPLVMVGRAHSSLLAHDAFAVKQGCQLVFTKNSQTLSQNKP